jgi:hypothetical protein
MLAETPFTKYVELVTCTTTGFTTVAADAELTTDIPTATASTETIDAFFRDIDSYHPSDYGRMLTSMSIVLLCKVTVAVLFACC